MKKVCIFKPRLDIGFKSAEESELNALPKPFELLPPIRQHWAKFVNELKDYHNRKGDDVKIIELPRFKIKKELAEAENADITYIPHFEKKDFNGDDSCIYYHQSVFPSLFTLDPKGFAGGSEYSEESIDFAKWNDGGKTFDLYKKRADSLISKYEYKSIKWKNPYKKESESPFLILLPLQIPNDYVIKNHSKISVKEFILKLTRFAHRYGSNENFRLILKHHPQDTKFKINRILEQVFKQNTFNSGVAGNNIVFVDKDVNIHSVLEQVDAVYLINSGVGIEAMLHDIPIVRFGDADYNSVVPKGNIDELESVLKTVKTLRCKNENMKVAYRCFYNWFINNICFDSNNGERYD